MFNVIDQKLLVQVLMESAGVELVSRGRPRDGFKLSVAVPHWISGFGGKYEMAHSNVPKGTMIAVGNIESLDFDRIDVLKEQLKTIDIYPTGHSGDFSGCNLEDLQNWFFSKSFVSDLANPQQPISGIKKLTESGLGQSDYSMLVEYLSDNMNLFRNLDGIETYTPSDKGERVRIVKAVLDGLSKTVRYTRRDENAQAYQLVGQVSIEKSDSSAINLFLREESKILVVRKVRDGFDLTPLDREMIGNTYVTMDGKDLADRAQIDIFYIMKRANEIAREKESCESVGMKI